MKITFVIAEYNPLHTGHAMHLAAAKTQTEADKLVVIMSGSVTERGDFAVADRKTRAMWASVAGADSVLELPVCYALNNAETFATGALKLVAPFAKNNDVTLSFGSECGHVEPLLKAAEVLSGENDVFKATLKSSLAKGESFPTARSKAVAAIDKTASEVLAKPNNILAVEYIRAAKKLGLTISFHTIKRQNDYNSLEVGGQFASASAIRNVLFSGDRQSVQKYLPKYVLDTLSPAFSDDRLSTLVLYGLNGKSTAEIADLPEVSEGLENRIKAQLKVSSSYLSLIENVKTKRYTMAKIKRIMLYSVLNLDKISLQNMTAANPYFNFLVADADVLKCLAASGFKGIVKTKDAEILDDIQLQSYRLDCFAASVRDIVYP